MKAYRTLQADMELFAAALTQTPVSVWQRTADDIPVLLKAEGIIEKYTPHIVKVDGVVYLRAECELRAAHTKAGSE